MRIELDMVPPRSTAQGKGCFVVDKKPVFFTKTKQKQDQNFYAALLYPHVPAEPFHQPLGVTITFVWPWLKTAKKKHKLKGWHYHLGLPDLDNAVKGLLDVMNRLNFFTDDKIICDLSTFKRDSDKGRVVIEIEVLSDN